MTEHIAITDHDGIRTIAMRRPDKKNALTQQMYLAMSDALEGASADATTRCILIAGVAGAFSAGNDLEDFLKAVESGAGISAAVRFLHALSRCEKPLVAAVDGLAVGIGTTLLFHCDHVVATPTARFLTPFTKLGLVPEGGSSVLAPRLLGHQRAFSLLVMGRPMDAAAAHAAGLVNTIADDVEAEALKAAREIAALPPEAVAISRRLLRLPPEQVAERFALEGKHFGEQMRSPEALNAFKGFLERKRA